ncbi:polyhydroxyalkanoate depolymerase [Aestuariivirga sp.]|uniref:polyhydroxyalkanoate depolymerase n=1 Tax=Aestuariivirga sp. TaxID=2650926 RepID=UPI0025C0FA8D|nr:polyhydroxyalkanoate depolymerase [Aestuariivirga sp.]MCA3554138.1 polyhydroxyalkanoate depolymerase [Aestuariivirga sp.]
MLYYLFEMNHAALAPWRAAADAGLNFWRSPANPLTETQFGRSLAASLELFERTTRRYGKPPFQIHDVIIDDDIVAVEERIALAKPFCTLLNFRKDWACRKPQHKMLIVAPMSGHYATLLRGTVETMLPHYDVYITDWVDARSVPMSRGGFDLDDYVDYVTEFLRFLGPDTSVMAVCQPSVPVMAAVSLMNAANDPCAPGTMILMGGPINTRSNPTAVNNLAQQKGVDWFRKNVIMKVPVPHAGMMRDVYPGFLQLGGFMTMNLDRHIDAHRELFWHLVDGDGDSAEKHREFYDEYMSVMDLTAEFYLQTVEKVFVNHDLPRGTLTHRNARVDPSRITRTALMTIEGERDDISGVGQTEAAQDLCSGLPPEKKLHHLQPGVGHYGVFNGSRFRKEIVPRIVAFVNNNAHDRTAQKPEADGGARTA